MKRIWILALLMCLVTMAWADSTGIVAYSDTAIFNDTCVAPAASAPTSSLYSFSASTDDWSIDIDDLSQVFSSFKHLIFSNGWLFALAMLLFVALPFTALLLIILIIVMLLRKRESPKPVQTVGIEGNSDACVVNGQAEETCQNEQDNRAKELRQLGVRRCGIGAGILLLCIFIDSSLGIGIGCLLVCIGISNIINGKNSTK